MQAIQLQKSAPSLESIALGAKVVSIESLALHRPNLQLFRKLGDLVDDVSDFVNKKLVSLRASNKTLDLDKLMRAIAKENYLELGAMEVPVPEGLAIPWLDYLKVLEHANDIAMRLYDDALVPFSLFIGQAINDPQKIANESFQHGAIIHDLDQVREALLNAKRNGKRTTARYDAVVGRNNDWSEVEDRMNRLLEIRRKLPQEQVRKTVVELDSNIKLLLKRMADTNLQYRPSPSVISQLADICHNLAEQVSYYAVVTTLVLEAQVALEDTQTQLK